MNTTRRNRHLTLIAAIAATLGLGLGAHGGQATLRVTNDGGVELVVNKVALGPYGTIRLEVESGVAGELDVDLPDGYGLRWPPAYPVLDEGSLYSMRLQPMLIRGGNTTTVIREPVPEKVEVPVPVPVEVERPVKEIVKTPVPVPVEVERPVKEIVMTPVPVIGDGKSSVTAPSRVKPPTRGAPAGNVSARILSKLDTDGIYLKMINAEQFEQEAIARIKALCLIGYRLAYEDDRPAALKFAARVGDFVKDSGLFAIRGCGESIAQGDGPWWKTKSFLMREPLAGTDLSVKAPSRYLPDTSYIACASTFNLSGICSLFEATLQKREPELYGQMQAMKGELSAAAQMGDIGALLASFGPGFLFSVASDPTVVLPSRYGRSTEIPGVLLGFRLNGEDAVVALRSFFESCCSKARNAPRFETTGSGDLSNVVFFDFSQSDAIEVLECPFALSFAYDRAGKMLLASTSRELIRRSIRSSRGQGGSLEDSRLFKAHAAGLPHEGDLFWFSPEFVPKLIKEVLSSDLIGVENEKKAQEAVKVISLFLPAFWRVSRSVQEGDGILTVANRPAVESTSVMLIEHYYGVSLMSLAGTIWQILPEDSFADFLMRIFGAWKDAGEPLPFDIDDVKRLDFKSVFD